MKDLMQTYLQKKDYLFSHLTYEKARVRENKSHHSTVFHVVDNSSVDISLEFVQAPIALAEFFHGLIAPYRLVAGFFANWNRLSTKSIEFEWGIAENSSDLDTPFYSWTHINQTSDGFFIMSIEMKSFDKIDDILKAYIPLLKQKTFSSL